MSRLDGPKWARSISWGALDCTTVEAAMRALRQIKRELDEREEAVALVPWALEAAARDAVWAYASVDWTRDNQQAADEAVEAWRQSAVAALQATRPAISLPPMPAKRSA